ncbi:MAG: hypothetical protein JXL20_10130, partial [Deltaproteobacteria bacterium]|nr:hypothetical protein [Deltaproteobacteria bacterium]
RLIRHLRRQRGDLRLTEGDFIGWSRGARFYPLLYMMNRVCHAQDWETGVGLSKHLLGRTSGLELHHIFPKAKLYEHQYQKDEVNALANFTFLTQETNLLVSDRDPAEYLAEYAAKNPGVLESHWIPMDRALWRYENYPDFLSERRKLLARQANEFLESLVGGELPDFEVAALGVTRTPAFVPGGVESEAEARLLHGVNEWVADQDLPRAEFMYQLAHPESGELLAIVDLAWPEGLQPGLSQPVALLIDEGRETREAVNQAGYRYFTDVDSFKRYVVRDILSVEDWPENGGD